MQKSMELEILFAQSVDAVIIDGWPLVLFLLVTIYGDQRYYIYIQKGAQQSQPYTKSCSFSSVKGSVVFFSDPEVLAPHTLV